MNRVIVFGSINMDCVSRVERHPQPGETLPGTSLDYYPGGKGANQAVAASRLGTNTFMIGKVGNDGFADCMVNFLKKEKVDISHVGATDSATGTAFIAVNSAGENTIIVIPAANGANAPVDIDQFTFAPTDILVCQNEIPSKAMTQAFQNAAHANAKIIYNPAPAIDVPVELFNLADIIIVNESENKMYEKQLDSFSGTIVKTLEANGVKVTDGNESFHIEGKKVEAIDTTGAGDCFTGALAAALAKGQELRDAIIFANTAASIAVQRHGAGTGMPCLHEVEAHL